MNLREFLNGEIDIAMAEQGDSRTPEDELKAMRHVLAATATIARKLDERCDALEARLDRLEREREL